MKKVTFETIYTALTNFGYDNQEVLDELTKEINKGAEVKAKNAEAYAIAKPIVLGVLTDTPVTIGEIYDEVANDLPEGFTKGKVQYAITRLWADEVTKVEGKTNGYCRKA